MEIQTAEKLAAKNCAGTDNRVAKYPDDLVHEQLTELPGWSLTEDGKRIRKEWNVGNFLKGLAFFEKVGEIAEAAGHHPDLHLENYKDAAIEIWTHTLDGLSENDFILAAKIDQLST